MRCTPDPVCRAILVIILIICTAIAGCTSSGPSPTTPTQVPGAATVNIQNFAFVPASITVAKGTTVTWLNQDATDHQIVNDARGTTGQGILFTSSSLQKGAKYSFRFDTPGTYPYHCSIHPSMKATVIVT